MGCGGARCGRVCFGAECVGKACVGVEIGSATAAVSLAGSGKNEKGAAAVDLHGSDGLHEALLAAGPYAGEELAESAEPLYAALAYERMRCSRLGRE